MAPIDYRALLKRYMVELIWEDSVVALNAIQDCRDENRPLLLTIAREIATGDTDGRDHVRRRGSGLRRL